MRTWWLLAMVSVTPLFPGGGAEPRETSSTAGAVEWLVAEGLVAPEVVDRARIVEQTVRVPAGGAIRFNPVTNVLEGVRTPAAQPAVPPHAVGCQGVGGSYGYMSDPPGGVLGFCLFTIFRVPLHSSYLACAGADVGSSFCFQSAVNFEFANSGLYEIYCSPQGPVGVKATIWQGSPSSGGTLNCTTVLFGVSPSLWHFWRGVCGGSEAVGTWTCMDLLE